jgi:hypothetical protein
MAELGASSGLFFVKVPGKISEIASASALHLAGTLPEFKKFMLKLKLGTRGILGILGICGILKLDRSCKESLMALTREFTCSRWFSKRASSPKEEALEREW